MNPDAGDVIAALALLASIAAALLAYITSKRQTKLAQRHVELAEAQHALDTKQKALEQELATYELEDARAVREARTKALLEADLRGPSPGKWPEVVITNAGGAPARDIDVVVLDAGGEAVGVVQGHERRLPIRRLDPGGEAKLYVKAAVRTRRPLTVRLLWTNPDGSSGERAQQVDW